MKTIRTLNQVFLAGLLGFCATGCGRQALVSSSLPLKRVVIYRNGVGYFERGGKIDEPEVRFKMKQEEVGDFLATLAVMEEGGSSVRAAAFPLDIANNEDAKPRSLQTSDEKKGLKTVVLSLDGKSHDLQVGYIAASPVWRPSYRLVVHEKGEADLQAWGVVQNLSGEDWKDVRLSLVAGSPLAFEAQLGTPVIPERPVVTDNGDVMAVVPKAETSLEQGADAPPPPPAAEPQSEEEDKKLRDEAEPADAYGAGASPKSMNKPSPAKRGGGVRAESRMGPMGAAASGSGRVVAPAPAQVPAMARMRKDLSPPRNLSSLAAVAVEQGTTRYDLPVTVTVPDNSATMVMLLSRKMPGEVSFLFAPDPGVPESSSHPFRVARFKNGTGGVLERGPIAVFEEGSFLGQGLVEPLPAGASATVPFALERSVAVDEERKFDELGERVAKIENGELTIERDAVTQTKYRLRNGGEKAAKVILKHPRINGTRLFQPPPETEDNVGTGSALISGHAAPRATTELVVDERATIRRVQDWFSPVADNAVKAFLADPRANRDAVSKLSTAWGIRNEIVTKQDKRASLGTEQNNLAQQTEETRRNLRAIEKNKSAEALRAKLTARLGENASRLDEITKQAVEIDSKLAELRVRFKEAIRDIKITEAPPPKA